MRKPTHAAISALAGVCVIGVGVAGAVAAPSERSAPLPELLPAALPLGPAGLPEQRHEDELAPGVTLHRIVRGAVDPDDLYTATVGFATTPEAVAALIDPRRFDGTLQAELALDQVAGRETTSAIAERLDATAAVNGGFFTIDGGRDVPGPWLEGTDGDPAGISVVGGRLVSEAVGDRPALMLTHDGDAQVRRLATTLRLRAGRDVHEVTGLNREPGLVVNCGGVGTATPSSMPLHDYTCGNEHELVAFTDMFGAALADGAGYQVRVDVRGRVVDAAAARGGAEPVRGEVVVQATGDAVGWLAEHGTTGARLRLDTRVVDGDTGRRVPLGPDSSVLNGGPLLVDDGAKALDPVRDGRRPEPVAGTARADFYWRWYVRRNPRTAAGVLPDGRIVFVQVDGRQPGTSVGLSITETAQLMLALGVEEAINLDGGGSSAVVTEDGLVNTPSDPVERPVGDAVVLTPRR